MKKLVEKWESMGDKFEVLSRTDRYAIATRLGANLSYEVAVISKNDAYEAFGKRFDASETWPSTNSWGKKGWTFVNKEDAFEKYNQLINKGLEDES